MHNITVSNKYAKVILDISSQKTLDAIKEFVNIWDALPILRNFSTNNFINFTVKEDIISEIVKNKKAKLIIMVLIKNNRIGIIKNILERIKKIKLKKQKKQEMIIESAVLLQDDIIKNIQNMFLNKKGVSTIVSNKINKNLGLGFIAYTEDYILDSSTHNFISNIKENYTNLFKRHFSKK